MKLKEILYEAKELHDLRHDIADSNFLAKIKKNWNFDVDKDYIHPSLGFFFHYHNGILVIHSFSNYSWSLQLLNKEIQDGFWNQLNGLVDLNNKAITINKVYIRNNLRAHNITDIKQLQKALKELKYYGVDDDFKVKGAANKLPSTVGAILKMTDPTDMILNQKPTIMYHGTSMRRWRKIQKDGLHPNKTPDAYNDLIPEYSKYNIYLATNAKGAEFYGKRQAKKDNDDEYVVLKINVPDPAKIMADDRYMQYQRLSDEHDEDGMKYWISYTKDELRKMGQQKDNLKLSRESGEYAYRGNILPSHIKLIKIGKL